MRSRALGVALAVATLGCASHRVRGGSSTRPTTVVHISGFKFAPAEITVSARDSIVWINDDDFAHTSTADNGTWSSPEFTKGGRYALIAPAPGRYTYHCAAHPGMKASLEVRLEE
jgi:plastocyanin